MTALEQISLQLGKSQILALLGPSGSGKSTLLAAIAGLIQPTAGSICLDGQPLLHLPVEKRGLGMVFQDYALWPHMTVAQNIAFPLQQQRIPVHQIRLRVAQALERVGLEGYGDRYPGALSGGQQQRVALARAVVGEPRLLLLDEPFSALDPATRAAVRAEIGGVLRQLQLTTVLVTHDREEAFELADQVAILLEGRIQQLAPPQEVYEQPATVGVAQFLGLNLIPVEPGSHTGTVRLAGRGPELRLLEPVSAATVYLSIPPERVLVLPDQPRLGAQQIRAQVLNVHYSGGEYRLSLQLLLGERVQRLQARSPVKPTGETVVVELPAAALHGITEVEVGAETLVGSPSG
ncbi:MAG: ABC transporter ATP-binding protein [Thermostichus sp. DG02_5_bins_236]